MEGNQSKTLLVKVDIIIWKAVKTKKLACVELHTLNVKFFLKNICNLIITCLYTSNQTPADIHNKITLNGYCTTKPCNDICWNLTFRRCLLCRIEFCTRLSSFLRNLEFNCKQNKNHNSYKSIIHFGAVNIIEMHLYTFPFRIRM